MKKHLLPYLCLLKEQNKILLQKRNSAVWHGVTLPGGHVEARESIVQACIRKMKEETGLTVLNPRLCGVKQFQTDANERYLIFLFIADQYNGTLVSSSEGEMFWAERNALDNFPLVDDFKELLQVMESESLSEFYYERHTEKEKDWTVELY